MPLNAGKVFVYLRLLQSQTCPTANAPNLLQLWLWQAAMAYTVCCYNTPGGAEAAATRRTSGGLMLAVRAPMAIPALGLCKRHARPKSAITTRCPSSSSSRLLVLRSPCKSGEGRRSCRKHMPPATLAPRVQVLVVERGLRDTASGYCSNHAAAQQPWSTNTPHCMDWDRDLGDTVIYLDSHL
jgi:hypothetical protein